MRFREHRGSLEESMKTLVVLKDRDALIQHCQALLEPFLFLKPEDLEVTPYSLSPDERIGWAETYVVMLKKHGVIGFTDSLC